MDNKNDKKIERGIEQGILKPMPETEERIKNLEVASEKTKRKILLKKYKGILKKYYDTVEFKEPIGILLRRNGRAEFHEDLSTSTWTIKHSDGEERTILLDSRQIHVFDYGTKSFRGYILHEDHPLPLPTDPLITLEEMGTTIDKVLTDIKDWKIKETRAKGDLIWKGLVGVALIVLAFAMYRMLAPQDTTGVAEQVAGEALNQTINNTIQNTMPTIDAGKATIITG